MTFIYVQLPDLKTLSRVTIKNGHLAGDVSGGAEPMDEGWREGFIGTMYYVSMSNTGNGKERKYRTRMIDSWEDPGTGSASCGLACFLAKEFIGEGDGREIFVFEQGVEMGRRNEITVEVEVKRGEIEKVWLSGEAVVVMEGTLEV
jgi:PhzF family phenazine biosynthesis protein